MRVLFVPSLLACAATAVLHYGAKDLTILGRHSQEGELSWPSSAYSFAVSCAGEAALRMTFAAQEGTSFYLGVWVDKKEAARFHINTTNRDVFFGLATSAEVRLVRVSEANYSTTTGVMQLENLVIDNGVLLPPEQEEKRLLFIGDSLTCGYGNLGTDPCSFDASTEDVMQSYPSVLADLLAAPLGLAPAVHTVCYSGKGVVRNYNGSAPDLTMPVYYNRSIATQEGSYWDPLLFPANVVYIMLGSNDYSTEPVPQAATFVDKYLDFLRRVANDYPSAEILAACAPQHWEHHPDQCAGIKVAEAAFKREGGAVQYVQPAVSATSSYGCDGHPSAQMHRQIAESLLLTFLSALKV